MWPVGYHAVEHCSSSMVIARAPRSGFVSLTVAMKLGSRHTRKSRERIALSQRESHERRERLALKRSDDHQGYVKSFYALGQASADRDIMLVLARRALATADDGDSIARWRKWTNVLERGARVKVSSHPVEVYAGDDLKALEALAAFLDSDKFDQAVKLL